MAVVTILALSWRDIKHPQKGGAEVQTHGMLSRLDSEKYRVVHISPLYAGGKEEEIIDGITYIRKGNAITVIFFAFFYYILHRKSIDYVLDECNTHRFFTPLYVPKKKRIFLIYQLTREIWFINTKFPLNWIGYLLENALLRIYKNTRTITESESTKNDLVSIGFKPNNVEIIKIGIDKKLIDIINTKPIDKNTIPTFIYVGRYSAYKGIDLTVKAFLQFKKKIPDAKLWIVGKINNEYLEKKIEPLCCNNVTIGVSEENDIVTWGFVEEDKKYALMKKATVLLFPSVREGWGIIVTEAAMLGTPSIVTNAPGCIDAVNYGMAGYVCESRTAECIEEKMFECVNDKNKYNNIVRDARKYASNHDWKTIEKKINDYFKKL